MALNRSKYNPRDSVERITIKNIDCLLKSYLADKKEKGKNLLRDGCDFNILHLKLGDVVREYVDFLFEEYDVESARIHEFSPKQYAVPHFDSGYDGLDTFIVRIDKGKESRLKIEGILVPEHYGVGYKLPSGTLHEVILGKETRYTLTVWGKSK